MAIKDIGGGAGFEAGNWHDKEESGADFVSDTQRQPDEAHPPLYGAAEDAAPALDGQTYLVGDAYFGDEEPGRADTYRSGGALPASPSRQRLDEIARDYQSGQPDKPRLDESLRNTPGILDVIGDPESGYPPDYRCSQHALIGIKGHQFWESQLEAEGVLNDSSEFDRLGYRQLGPEEEPTASDVVAYGFRKPDGQPGELPDRFEHIGVLRGPEVVESKFGDGPVLLHELGAVAGIDGDSLYFFREQPGSQHQTAPKSTALLEQTVQQAERDFRDKVRGQGDYQLLLSRWQQAQQELNAVRTAKVEAALADHAAPTSVQITEEDRPDGTEDDLDLELQGLISGESADLEGVAKIIDEQLDGYDTFLRNREELQPMIKAVTIAEGQLRDAISRLPGDSPDVDKVKSLPEYEAWREAKDYFRRARRGRLLTPYEAVDPSQRRVQPFVRMADMDPSLANISEVRQPLPLLEAMHQNDIVNNFQITERPSHLGYLNDMENILHGAGVDNDRSREIPPRLITEVTEFLKLHDTVSQELPPQQQMELAAECWELMGYDMPKLNQQQLERINANMTADKKLPGWRVIPAPLLTLKERVELVERQTGVIAKVPDDRHNRLVWDPDKIVLDKALPPIDRSPLQDLMARAWGSHDAEFMVLYKSVDGLLVPRDQYIEDLAASGQAISGFDNRPWVFPVAYFGAEPIRPEGVSMSRLQSEVEPTLTPEAFAYLALLLLAKHESSPRTPGSSTAGSGHKALDDHLYSTRKVTVSNEAVYQLDSRRGRRLLASSTDVNLNTKSRQFSFGSYSSENIAPGQPRLSTHAAVRAQSGLQAS